MSVIERARVPKSITRTYCARPDCDGEGFYSARCQSAGHATEDVEYVPAGQLRKADAEIARLRAELTGAAHAAAQHGAPLQLVELILSAVNPPV